ncbi:MAG TPA: zinc dependent phospholipase C family protein [Gemmatimonadaceae bacterium]|nr:zinc dependent phospholipase C family protein [Gemmatimonadaceae bacterium]
MTLRKRCALALLLVCILPNVSLGYAVLAHEAIIDAMWDSDIVPALRSRFPDATALQLREAHAYAYGGSIIPDLGYYPFGSVFYSDLTHYARSGDFVETLIRDAATLDEFAFALGVMSHYAADNLGHPISTNHAVPLLYPKLRAQFGDSITFEQKKSAHIQTEFGFDVVQVARGHYATQAYHDFIGFHVARALLERAFRETYGLDLKSLFLDYDLALGTYRRAVSGVIPKMTHVAWEKNKTALAGIDSAAGTSRNFEFHISRADYEAEWGPKYKRPGWFSRFLSFLLRIVPKIGPFKGYAMRSPTPQTEALFVQGFNAIVKSYRSQLGDVRAGTIHLPNTDLDTGVPTRPGEYGLADKTYAKLVDELADAKYATVDAALRRNIVSFYLADPAPKSRELTRQLEQLKATEFAHAGDR